MEKENKVLTDNELKEVCRMVSFILEMMIDNFESWKDTPWEGRTIKQCKKFLADFDK